MSDLIIKKHPEPVLRKKTAELKEVGAAEKKLIEEMAETMYKVRGVGLAAPQIGMSKSLIIADAGERLVKMVNPKILSKKGKATMEEGCLSIPGQSVNVQRAEEITVAYTDENGEQRTEAFSGLSARIIQHEIDHLNGKLIIDYLPWWRKKLCRCKKK